MTPAQAIAALDELTPNSYTLAQKLQWLNQVEMAVAQEVFHAQQLPELRANEPMLCNAPYDDAYVRYMQAQIFLEAGEITRYNNAMALYNRTMAQLQRHRIRRHGGDHPGLTGF